jgi:AraC-like DNA-binding protein
VTDAGAPEQDIIRSGCLWGYRQLTQFLGCDPAPLLAEAGVAEQSLDDPDTYIPRPAVVELLERTAERTACSDFGLRLGRVQDVNVLGALAFAIRNASDLRAAVAVMIRHIQYQAPLNSVSVQPDGSPDTERIILHHAHDSGSEAVQMAERAVGLLCRIDDHLTGEPVREKRVLFRHAPVSSSDVYAEHLGVVPEFGSEVTAVCMDRRDLALPLRSANRQLQILVERYLELNSPAPGPQITPRVRMAIGQIMRHDNASVEDVADMLQVHPRTLQRRLMEEGATFERLRDDVRKQLAEIYLGNELVPLAEVAHLLGYANQSVLTRSCLRWFGKTPLAMRQQIVARGR